MPRLSSLSSLPFNPLIKISPFFATLTPNITTVAEGTAGNDVVFTVTTRNIPSGTLINWDANGPYYSFAPSYGSFTVNNNAGTFTVRVASDDVPEVSETFTISLYDENYDVLIRTSSSVSVTDFGWNTSINTAWTTGTANLNGASGWTAGTSRDAFYDGSRYVVCGSDASFPANDVPLIGYSTNGTTWTAVNLSAIFTNNYIECGASNGAGVSVVMSNFGAAVSTGGNLNSWTDVSTAVDNAGLSNFQSDIIWNGIYFMATGSSGSANFVRSTNGTTWTGFSGFNSVMTSGGSCLAANGSTVIAVGGFGVAAISTDAGATWSDIPGFATELGATVLGHGIAYGGGRWVYAGGNRNFMNSTDGTTWVKRTAPAGWNTSGTNKLIYKNGVFVLVGNSNSNVAYSIDGGVTWRTSLTYASNNLWSITADNPGNTVLVLTNNGTIPSTFSLPTRPA